MQHLQSLRQKYKALRLARHRISKAMEAALWRRKDWEDSGPDPADTTGRRRLWRWQGAPPAGGKVPRPRTQIRKPGTGRGAARQEQETTPVTVQRPPSPVSGDAEIAAMVQRARQELRQERSQAWRTTQNPLDLTEALQVDALNADGRYDFPLWMFVRVATRDTILTENDASGRSLRPALRLLDKYAAGQATDGELQRANGSNFLGPRVAVGAAKSAANRVISARAIHDDADDARVQAEAYYADILRGLIGDPYQPVRLPPINHDMVNLARAAYASQLSDNSLHPTQLDILADALEEAGAPVEVIKHLRSPIPHYQGDWVIEAILKNAPAAAEAAPAQETTPMKRKRPPAVVVTEEEAERLGRQFVEQHEDPEFARMAMQRLGAERHMLLNQALLERAARAGLRNARVRRPSPAVVAAYVRGLLAAVEGLPVMDQEVSNELLARRDAAVRARRGQ